MHVVRSFVVASLLASGTAAQAQDIPISVWARNQDEPAVAFDGQRYLVVWRDVRNAGPNRNWDILGAFVTEDGEVDPTEGLPICTAPGEQLGADVSYGDGQYLVAFETGPEYTERHTVGVVRIGDDGTVLDAAPIDVSTNGRGASQSLWVHAAFGAGIWLVTWTDDRADAGNVYGARVDAEGAVLDPEGLPLAVAPGYDEHPAVAFDGTAFWVAWSSGTAGVQAVRVDGAGTVLDAAPIAIAPAPAGNSNVEMAWSGDTGLLAWTSVGGQVLAARVADDGTALDGDPIDLGLEASVLGLAGSATGFLAVGDGQDGGASLVDAAFVEASGLVSDPTPRPVWSGSSNAFAPGVGAGTRGFLVAWSDMSGAPSDQPDVLGHLVTAEGSGPSDPDAGPDGGDDAGPNGGQDAGPGAGGPPPSRASSGDCGSCGGCDGDDAYASPAVAILFWVRRRRRASTGAP